MTRLLLDTNAYTAWKRGDRRLLVLVAKAERLYLSTIVAGELMFGYRYGNRYAKNLAELEAFIASPFVELVDATLETADRFGQIAAALRRRGKPIPTNDVWIAAHSLQTGAHLVSFDAHFAVIDGLSWIDPAIGA